MALLDDLDAELRSLSQRGLRRELRSVQGPQEARFHLEGREVLNFSSNNYLGLANHAALREAAARALHEQGLGAGASRLIAGNLGAHQHLEARLAAYHRTEAALLFNSGYQANIGVLTALAGPKDVIFSDELNHASLIDGCRLSRARTEVYAHRSVDDLARRLASSQHFRRRLIVTDTLFSMDGDLAPLRELRVLADRHQAVLIVDEAHTTGVLGPDGRGLAAELDVAVDVHIATLGKAFGAFGAYVTGPRTLVDFLINRARSFIFTTALPPSIVAAADAALDVIRSPEGERLRERLRANVSRLAANLGRDHSTPIFPVPTGTAQRTMEISQRLLSRGLYAQGIRPPTVPDRGSRLRIALMATHELEQIDLLSRALQEIL